jgi:hypothetical protein
MAKIKKSHSAIVGRSLGTSDPTMDYNIIFMKTHKIGSSKIGWFDLKF